MRCSTKNPHNSPALLGVIAALVLSLAAIGPPQVGWVFFSADPLPAGAALFSFVNVEGVLIWEAGIPAVKSTTRGRIFVDQRGKTSTGIAIANVLPFDTVLTLVLRDQFGVEIARIDFPIPGNNQRALFIDQIFDDLPTSFIGSLTFETAEESHKVATVTVRGNTNARAEALFATLDVIDLADPSDQQVAVLPQVGGAHTLSTQIGLVERSGQETSGRIRLFDSEGAPLELESGGGRNSEFAYELPPHGVMLLELTRSEGTGVGYAVVSLEQGSVVPSAAAIFQFRSLAPAPATSAELGSVLTEAGILSRPATTHARLFVDSFRTLTGVALASPGNPETEVTFRLIRDDGTFRETTRTLAAGGHLAVFTDQLFPGLDRRDSTLEIISPNPLNLTTLKLSTNERNEPVLTTLPFLDLTSLESGIRYFPQVVIDGGFSTRLIFVGASELVAEPGGQAFQGGRGADSLRARSPSGSHPGQCSNSTGVRTGIIGALGENSLAIATNFTKDPRQQSSDARLDVCGAYSYRLPNTASDQAPVHANDEPGINAAGCFTDFNDHNGNISLVAGGATKCGSQCVDQPSTYLSERSFDERGGGSTKCGNQCVDQPSTYLSERSFDESGGGTTKCGSQCVDQPYDWDSPILPREGGPAGIDLAAMFFSAGSATPFPAPGAGPVYPGSSEICDGVDEDCADEDVLIRPGAVEMCNDVDEVCNLGTQECDGVDCDVCYSYGCDEGNQGGFGVYLHSREVYLKHVDLEIPGRGFSWRLERTYRSRTQHDGIQGHNWFLNYSRRLIIIREDMTLLGELGFPAFAPRFKPGDVVLLDGLRRVDLYKPNPDGSYRSPRYVYTRLIRLEDGSFLERDRRGSKVYYDFPDGAGVARMVALSDRHGNTMRFEHDRLGRLVRVIDTLGRSITYHYNADGRLIRIQDFMGRQVRFAYDENGNLVESTSPAVTGTPSGNDFPDGKTTRYVYRGIDHPIFGHDLIQLYLPNDVAEGGDPRIEILYADDYVFRVTIGGINRSGVPAGGTLRYTDRSLVGSNPFDPDRNVDLNKVVLETDVTDPNGNFTTYGFNKLKNIISVKVFTRDVRPGDPEFYETLYEYNQDGQRLKVIYPEGNSVDRVFDDTNPDRWQQGNLRRIVQTPDAGRGGDQETITTTFTYEPVYNQVHTLIEERGNDPGYEPQNGGVNSPERYTRTFTRDYQEGDNLEALAEELSLDAGEIEARLEDAGVLLKLGDLNDDGVTDDISGDVIRIESPTVNLLPGSNMRAIEGSSRQSVVSHKTYNRFGQITSSTDEEGNRTERQYYPENDPDGDGRDLTGGVGTEPFGYLKQTIRDTRASPGRNSGTNPTPAEIRTRFFYDPVGNVTRVVDGRGIWIEYSVNQLNQVVQIMRAAGHNAFAPDPPEPPGATDFKYLEHIFYDFNNNVVVRQVEDRGNTSAVDGNLPALHLPPTASNPDPAGGAAFVDTVYLYDTLDNLVEILQEVGGGSEPLQTLYRYDSNQNPALVIRPEGNAQSAVYDERDLIFQYTRGAATPPVSALLGGDDPVDYDVRGGEPSTQSFHYDLNQNLIEVVDAADTDSSSANNSDIAGAGDRTRYTFDGFDRLAGSVDSVGNQSVIQYDPAGNVVRLSRFGPVGGESPTADGPDQLPGPVSVNGVIQANNLVSDSLLETTEILYDELGRPFQIRSGSVCQHHRHRPDCGCGRWCRGHRQGKSDAGRQPADPRSDHHPDFGSGLNAN